ncbi:MAG: polysaccharide deacetylase family protein [Sphingobium sp.]|uniref:polysaccharide deacetylase family protein n=1 Tax=Sphingobium sp. TaxID=1912891 RepID=UPI0029A0893A|nr:polysaccharide deacetylase family protein [Sphingobium sp.]MDX3909753.1 polysaccharide deacetylase family protein [Sphingobium sp.]
MTVPLPNSAHDGGLLRPPLNEDRIALDPAFGTRFTLFVDTEEEFDWSAPFSRTGHKVTSVAAMTRGQKWFSQAGVKPVYVADYPVIDDLAASSALAQWMDEGTADVGAHLHPWVNPPHVEQVSVPNSYVGFLPEAVEKAKLEALCARFEAAFGKRPAAYRAGRYGVGPNSARLLEQAGFRLDSSVRSLFDYSAQQGPAFYGLPVDPYWAGPERKLVELPLSTVFVGRLRGIGPQLFRAAEGIELLTGGLSRAGLLSRVPLTPEGVSAGDAICAIDALIEDGVRVLNFSFHSPTLEPGHTPYVRDAADLEGFYRWWGQILEHLAKRSVLPASLDEFLDAVPARAALGCKVA